MEMAKSKQYISMSKRSNVIIVHPTSESQREARARVREEFSPKVVIETNPKSYLVAFSKKSPSQRYKKKTINSKSKVPSLGRTK